MEVGEIKNKVLSLIIILAVSCILISPFLYIGPAPEFCPPSVDKGVRPDVDTVYNQFSNDVYLSQKPLSALPHTFEAWLYINEDIENHCVIYGNYDGHLPYYINVAVKKGVPMIYWSDSKDSQFVAVFEKAYVCKGKYVHLAIVNDAGKGKLLCYIDGILCQTLEGFADFGKDTIKPKFSVFTDNRKLASQYFRGKLYSVSVFADVRSESEIQSDMQKVDTNDKNLLCHYLFDKKDNNIKDASQNGNDLTHTACFLTEEEAECFRSKDFERAFSIAVVPDTQFMTKHNPQKLTLMYQKIAKLAKEKNLQYLIGVGDITDSDEPSEWQTAKDAISALDGICDYSLVRGNHDLINGGAHFEKYFGKQPDNYDIQIIGDRKFLFLNLDYSPSEASISWASDVISENRDCIVIITTHAYLSSDGTRLIQAQALWDKLIKKHSQIKLVISGHVSSNQIVASKQDGVTQLLIDAQDYDKYLSGLGMVAFLHFDKSANKIETEYYSTVLDRYYRSSNLFTINLN